MGKQEKLPVYITKGDYQAIIGRAWLKKIRLDWQTERMLANKTPDLQAVFQKNKEVFRNELGSVKGITVKLHVKPDSKPAFLKARPVPYAVRPKVEADLNALVNTGVLEPGLPQ